MSAPIIIIGIGTSGLHAIEEAQRFHYETYKVNKPSNVEYLYIETNETNRPVGTPIGNDISRVYISLDNMAEMISVIKNSCEDPAWVPDSRDVLAAGMGAGGIRSCGRLALWGRNQKGDNFTNVIQAINNAYANVMSVTNTDQNIDSKPSVFITGSLTGGTGAGIFIDMGYLVRHLVQGIKDLYGLFLLPKEPVAINGHEVMYGNTYGAFKDLEYYNKIENNYTAKWPNGFLKDLEEPPFELAQFISQDYQDGAPAIRNLAGLYKMAGLYLFLNIAGIYEKRRERLVDAAGNSLIGKYGTFGLSAIQFPKDQIQEFVASDFCLELIRKLTDSKQYYLNNQLLNISQAKIRQNMDVAFDEILESGFATLNMVDRTDLLVAIEKDAVKINKGDIKGSKVDFITSSFASTRQDNYHALVSNNMKSAVDDFVDSIYEQVNDAVESTQNLYYAKYVLEGVVKSIENTLKYWKSIGVSSEPQKWDNLLRSLANGCAKKTYKSVLEQDEVLKDRMFAILELMKMHLAVRSLVDIRNHIRKGEIVFKGRKHDLPNLKFFDDLINGLTKLSGTNEDMIDEQVNFTRRIKDIESDVKDTTIPILRVYPSDSFKTECKLAKQVYIQKSGTEVRSITEVLKQANILDYFKSKTKRSFNEDVYVDFLKEIRLKIEQYECINDFDIANYINNHTEESIRTAKKATSPFLKINKVLNPNPSLPRFVVGDDNNEIKEVLAAFSSKNYNDFQDSNDGRQEILDLKNIIVFYDEKGNFSLTKDLSYIKVMKNSYEKAPSGLADENVTDERWRNNRSGYDTN